MYEWPFETNTVTYYGDNVSKMEENFLQASAILY